MTIEQYRELYEERAAIKEFDGKFSRQISEEKARNEITDLWLENEGLKMNEASTYKKIADFKKQLINK